MSFRSIWSVYMSIYVVNDILDKLEQILLCLEDHEPLTLGENSSFQVGTCSSAINFPTKWYMGRYILLCVFVVVVYISMVETLWTWLIAIISMEIDKHGSAAWIIYAWLYLTRIIHMQWLSSVKKHLWTGYF